MSDPPFVWLSRLAVACGFVEYVVILPGGPWRRPRDSSAVGILQSPPREVGEHKTGADARGLMHRGWRTGAGAQGLVHRGWPDAQGLAHRGWRIGAGAQGLAHRDWYIGAGERLPSSAVQRHNSSGQYDWIKMGILKDRYGAGS